MDNFDIIVYIVLIIAGLIASAIRKKTQNLPKDIVYEDDDPFEQIFGDAVREIKHVIKKEPEPEPESEKEVAPISLKEELLLAQQSSEQKERSVFKYRNTMVDENEISDEINNAQICDQEEENTVDFDLKSAVIFSEILNKKY